jgi:IS5 family transposase
MNKQITLSAFSDELATVRTKKKEFLSQIERIVPWGEWIEEIRPCYYKGERGNKPYDLELMLRLYVLQNLYDLSDMGTVAEVIDSRAFSDFCGVDSSNQVPDGDTLGRFRHILEDNGIQQKLFAQVVRTLMEKGLILKKGTIVDSTIVSAPSSTKNQKKERDPDAHSVKKGNAWHFGYKAHVELTRKMFGYELPSEAVIMGRCVQRVMECDMIILDKGWIESNGCNIEASVALIYKKIIKKV